MNDLNSKGRPNIEFFDLNIYKGAVRRKKKKSAKDKMPGLLRQPKSIKDLHKETGLASSTIRRILYELMSDGKVTKQGDTMSRTYVRVRK